MKYYLVPGTMHADKALGSSAKQRWVMCDGKNWYGVPYQPKPDQEVTCDLWDTNFGIWEYLRKDLMTGDLEKYLVTREQFFGIVPVKAAIPVATKCTRCGSFIDLKQHVCMECATPQKGYQWRQSQRK